MPVRVKLQIGQVDQRRVIITMTIECKYQDFAVKCSERWLHLYFTNPHWWQTTHDTTIVIAPRMLSRELYLFPDSVWFLLCICRKIAQVFCWRQHYGCWYGRYPHPHHGFAFSCIYFFSQSYEGKEVMTLSKFACMLLTDTCIQNWRFLQTTEPRGQLLAKPCRQHAEPQRRCTVLKC